MAAAAVVALCLLLSPGAAQAKTTWLCKPGQAVNPCRESLQTTLISSDGSQSVINPKNAKKPKVDCFYVYPTVSDQQTVNANLNIDPEQTAIARYQASRFSQRCRVFAPMYRQLTLKAINGTEPAPQSAVALAYGDVAAAWRDYMKNFNNGRPFVLIGHSQGSGMLTQLTKEKIDPFKKVRKRLLSAMLVGGNVTVTKGSDVGGAFKNVRACHNKRQRGCVIAYSTYNETPPDTTFFGTPSGALVDTGGRTDLEVLCTNPAALGGGYAPLETLIPTSEFPGTIGLGVRLVYNGTPPTAATPWVGPQDHYTGICQHSNGANVLMASPIGNARKLVPVPNADWGLHLADVNIALGNLVSLVGTQYKAYAKAKQGRRGSAKK